MNVTITKGAGAGKVKAIPSKSDAHRLLICAALADQPTTLYCPATSEDIEATAGVLRGLGATITRSEGGYTVSPITRCPEKCLLDCGESGSTLRFLLPVAAALSANADFVGRGRLPLRPMNELYETLCAHGSQITNECKLPFSLSGSLSAGEYEIGGSVSSQYLSGLLMGLPLLAGTSTVKVKGKLESAGYVSMTLHALERFGVQVQREDNTFTVSGGKPYKSPGVLTVEGDWSNSAFFLCLGALLEEGVTVTGLNEQTPQGDRAVLTVLERMGAQVLREKDAITVKKGELKGTVVDVKDIPDLVPVLSIVGALAQGETTFINGARLRAKESDRIKTVCEMITALGGCAKEYPDGLSVSGGLTGGTVNGAGDHRIVMSAAIAAAVCPVKILGAQAVNKSYPGFFNDLAGLGAQVNYEEGSGN